MLARKLATSWMTALLLGAVLVAPASASTGPAALSLPGLFDMLLDEDAGRIYYTAGHPHDGLFVTDLGGAPVGTITDLPSASGIDFSADGSSLFVALPASNAVAVVDVATLTESARFTLPTDVCPGSVATTAQYVAVGHSCNRYAGSGGYGGVGVLDPATGAWNPLEAPGPFYQPYVSAGPDSNGLFVTGDLGLSPTTLYTIGVYDGIGDTVSVRSNTGSNLRDLAVSPDDGLVVQASGSPYQHDAFGVIGLNPVLAYETTTYPNAVAWAADGQSVATGTDSPYDADVRVHLRDNPTPFATFELGARLAPRGLALSADGSTVFAVSETGGSFALHVLATGPVSVPSSVTLTGPASTPVGTPTTFSGTLSFADGSSASGRQIAVTRSYADVEEPLPAVTTGAGGSFSFTDSPSTPTAVTYTASFAGAGSYEASTTTASVAVEKRTTDLSIEAVAASGKKGRNKVDVIATLGETLANRSVTITATDQRGSRVIASGQVDSDGTLSVRYRLRRTTTFTVEFTGDAWYLPASAAVTVNK
ncbi:MAG: hypothetical protein KJO17_05180 [Acidimicrobiia bacterium]|nr:hypothetical protein [Acidimicrobiia bacterium]